MDTSAPLADYFWIAGVDSLSYGSHGAFGEQLFGKGPNGHAAAPPPAVDTTIEECAESEVGSPISPTSGNSHVDARHSRTNSWSKRLSKLSLVGMDENNDENGVHSNRSSVTIKGVATAESNGTNGGPGGTLENFDFDTALLKFAHEREDFLDDLSFNAGVITQQSRPPMTHRAERLRHDDLDSIHAGHKSPLLKSVGGSIRRRISFRDLNSLKRAPSRSSKFSLDSIPSRYVSSTMRIQC